MKTFKSVSKWYMALTLCFVAQSALAQTDVIFNAIDELAGNSPKKISIYGDSTNLIKGCTFNYGVSSPSMTPTVQDWKQLGWRVSEWRQLAGFCSKYVSYKPATMRSEVNGLYSQSMYFGGARISMGLRSIEHFRLRYGNVYFRNATEINQLTPDAQMKYKWPELFLSKSFEPRAIKDYKQINFAFTATLKFFANNTNRVSGNSPPYYSQVRYDVNQHATQFRIAMPVQWRDRSVCPKGNASDASAFCRRNFGKLVHVMFRILDDRFEYQSTSERWSIDGGGDKVGTGMAIYRMNMQQLLAPYNCNVVNKYGVNETKCNPFKVIDRTNAIATNLKPILTAALIEGSKNQALAAVFPQRIPGESDASFVSHFYLASANVGYEVSGLSSVGFDIHKFSLTGVK